MGFMYMCIPSIYCSTYYDVHYLYLLVMISQDEIMLAATVQNLRNKMKEALRKNCNVNAKEQDIVSNTLY